MAESIFASPEAQAAAEVAAEIIREKLPGFKTGVGASDGMLHVRGYLRIDAGTSLEALHYAVSPDFPQEVARQIVEGARNSGIDALGLEPVIRERVRNAEEVAYRSGRDAGFAEGEASGRAKLLAEFAAAIEGAANGIRDAWLGGASRG